MPENDHLHDTDTDDFIENSPSPDFWHPSQLDYQADHWHPSQADTPTSEDESVSIFSESDFAPEPLGLGLHSAVPSQPTTIDYETALKEFEELSLADVIGQFFRAPTATLQAFWLVIQPVSRSVTSEKALTNLITQNLADSHREPIENAPLTSADVRQRMRFVQLGAYFLAIVLAIWGCAVFVATAPNRTEAVELVSGFPYIVMACLVWLCGECVGHFRAMQAWWQALTTFSRVKLFSRVVPLIVILGGVSYLTDASDDPISDVNIVLFKIGQGTQIILLGVILWLLLIVVEWLVRYASELNPERFPSWLISEPKTKHKPETVQELEIVDNLLPWYMRIHPVRVFLVILATVLSTITWFGSANNDLPTLFFYIWLVSVACWALAFGPRHWWNPVRNVREMVQRVTNFNFVRYGWVVVAMLAILLLGAKFRLDNLTGNPADNTAIPQEMTSDHVEKLLDSERVKEGSRNIFFANNGGREPFQMYAMALFSELPGQGINHNSLKLLAVLESMLTLPVMFWLGYEVVGREKRRLGILTGLIIAGLVAASYWDVTVTRLALRIILTPLVASLLMIYLIRAVRYDKIGDYIKAGLVLGFGMYTYQAVRMLPLVAIAGIAIVWLWGRHGTEQRLRTIGNFIVLVLVAFMAFLPLYHYSVEHPEQFLRRAVGRILGDDIVEEKLPNGTVVQREASLSERLTAFNSNLPVLMNNVRNAVFMYNWKGDVAWINGVPNYPALDRYSGGLFIVGLMAWGVLFIRRRDYAYALVLVMIPIMLLPSALSIAFPIENPSFTRTTGTLPAVYLICAFPLALIADAILEWSHQRRAVIASVVVCALPILGSFSLNYDLYMTQFPQSYINSSLPYSDAGRVLQGFAISDGTFGNAFMIAYPYWWDHRAVGLAAGIEGVWPNGVYDTNPNDANPDSVDYLPEFMQDAFNRVDRFHYDPQRDLLFFYSPNDTVTSQRLKQWFPIGTELQYPSYQPNDNFMVFRAPALGLQGYQDFLVAHLLPR